MKIVVPNQSVRKNVELFKKIAGEQLKEKLVSPKTEPTYNVLVHIGTGELLILDPKEAHSLSKKEWKQVILHLKRTQKQEEFQVVPEKGKNVLDSKAEKILQDTLQVMNFLLERMKENGSTFLEELGKMEISPTFSKFSQGDLVYEAWHNVDRVQAESLLHHSPAGTFFFRKDEYASILENQLGYKCFTLTFVNHDKRVVDKTIVQKDKSFQFYNDDPNLDGSSFRSIDDLLESVEEKLFSPLLHTTVKS